MAQPQKNKDQIFLSYAHEDLVKVREIYVGLKRRNLNVWFDKEDLKAGKWKSKIKKAIPKSRYFIICISKAALRKTGDDTPGYQDEELQIAWELARDVTEKDFTIVPIRLEDYDRGDNRLKSYNQYDLFNDFERGLDLLAMNLGGNSLSDVHTEDKRTALQKKADTFHGKAEAAYYAGDSKTATENFIKVTQIKPDDASAWINIGISFADLGKHMGAIEAYDQAIEIKSDTYSLCCAWYNKGISLADLGKYSEAVKVYDYAIAFYPNLPLL